MAHLLLIDVPGGNDFTVMEDAVAAGHEVTFVTSDLSHYERQGELTARLLALASSVIEVKPFVYERFEEAILKQHTAKALEAVICLIDIRQIEASRIAHRLGLPFLSLETTRLMRDKVNVRQHLHEAGIRQPAFGLAHSVTDVRAIVADIGFPVVVKPADGYASQNVSMLKSLADLEAFCIGFETQQLHPTDYGLGVHANNRFSVERYIEGTLIGCDVFSDGTERILLGVNEKLMFPTPSFAIRGSQFPSSRFATDAVRDYAFALLDAVDYDFGPAHIEMIVADGVPHLVEINARLVSAQIPFQMCYALGRSIYIDLIDLHLGIPIKAMLPFDRVGISVIRWIVADRSGTLEALHLPEPDANIKRVTLFKQLGDAVRPPISNGDRIGYVIATAATAATATLSADTYVEDAILDIAG